MRHVSTAELHANGNANELTAALSAGDEIWVTLGGQEYRLVADSLALPPDRERAMATAAAFRQQLRDQGVRVTREDVREWIDEGHADR